MLGAFWTALATATIGSLPQAAQGIDKSTLFEVFLKICCGKKNGKGG
jgi:hypothetical protein